MATAEDVQFHYDVHNDFYALFLDSSFRAYSCGVWNQAVTLEEAQQAKIRRLCDFAKVEPGKTVLDIGCGWGGVMRYAIEVRKAQRAHGLTLSKDQHSYIEQLAHSSVSADLKSWQEYENRTSKFDSIVSIGAFEHFASREDRLAGKQREIYRQFFMNCRKFSTQDAHLGLQTIVSSRNPVSLQEMRDARYLLDKVFPGSALPSISDVHAAYLDVYELLEFRRIGKDYAKTLAVWCERLEAAREHAIEAFGENTFNHYVHYFNAAERSFDAGVTDLLQVSLRPIK
jgi:cyclopropane-fatty-acyl-phospholipid synthase